MRSRRGFAILLLFVTGFSVVAWSQSITGSIRGIVSDSDGQPLAGATVIIRSKALIGQSRSATTNTFGVFRFPSLPIGVYSVEARLEGFESFNANRVDVSLGGTANVPFTMKVARAEAITIMGETPLIELQNAGFSTIYNEEMLENLPIQRNMWVLMQVAPGVTTDYGDAQDPATIAFGSNRQSNSWNIDGIDVTGPETGKAWWYSNPDIIEQIQIYGIGAPAEYGNHTGAVLNVVTKKGSNNLHGGVNSFFQADELTDVNVRFPDSDFVFHRDKYYDITGQMGGPIAKDRVWFFGAFESSRDSYTTPGSDPNFAPLSKTDRYDFKVTTRLAEHQELTGFFHDEEYDTNDPPNLYIDASALARTFGTNPAWGAILTSTLSQNLLIEMGYAGWWGHELYGSQTGSLEDPYFNAGVYPNTISGGVYGVYDYTTYRHQLNGKATYYADRFLKSQHEFKFGVQYSYGSADTITGLGPNGSYTTLLDYYGSLYNGEQRPFHYGSVSQDVGLFVDDTLTVNDRLTLNLGIRFDHIGGSFPDYDRLEVGTPSITEIGNFRSTGQTIPGVNDYIQWNLVSPRLGFVWQTRADGRAVLRGSFGVYYDHDVMGNWNSPPPETPPIRYEYFDPNTGEWIFEGEMFPQPNVPYDQNLKPPRALQYAIGYEFQPAQNTSVGLQYVYKDTEDLIGWQFIGTEWEPFLFTDPFTGRQYTLLHPIFGFPVTIQKGNDPGDFPGSEGLRYFQKYHGVLLTFSKRFSHDWAINASYTWSKSYGLIPRMLSQRQFDPFYGSRGEGTNPNNYVNAEGRLQGDRPHMFRAQALFFKLPWDLQAAASLEFSSGRPYSRQIEAFEPRHPPSIVIMEPSGSLRHSMIQNIDLSFGKRIPIGNRFQLRLDGEILNLLNSDQELEFASLVLQDPSWTFEPVAWVQPRRLQVRIGLQF